jgi:hypothetical protein
MLEIGLNPQDYHSTFLAGGLCNLQAIEKKTECIYFGSTRNQHFANRYAPRCTCQISTVLIETSEKHDNMCKIEVFLSKKKKEALNGLHSVHTV